MSTITATFPFGVGFIGHPYSSATAGDPGSCAFYFSLTCTDTDICSDRTKQVYARSPRYPTYYNEETTVTLTAGTSSDFTILNTDCYRPEQFTWTTCTGYRLSDSFTVQTLEGPSERNAAQVPLTRGSEEPGVFEAVSSCLASGPTGVVPITDSGSGGVGGVGDQASSPPEGGTGGTVGSGAGSDRSSRVGLTLRAKIGIGLGAFIAALLLLAGIVLLVSRYVRKKRDSNNVQPQQQPPYATEPQMQQGAGMYQRPVYELEQPMMAQELPGGLQAQPHELPPQTRRWELEAR